MFKMETIVDIPLIQIIALANESELYTRYVPFLETC